jgi:hypothetical protein
MRNWLTRSNERACYTARVKVGPRQGLAVVFALTGLVACGVASAASGPWVSFVDKSYGIRVTIPKSWHTVPPTVAGVQSLIGQLAKKKEVGLAQVYSSFIASTAARQKMLSYHFQAFQYSTGSAIQPDFALAFARTSRAYTVKDLATTSKSVARQFTAVPGTTITKQTVVTLPAGPAGFVEGTQPVAGGSTTQFQIYIIAHGTLLYDLSFRADARATSEAATFTAIARRFAFV